MPRNIEIKVRFAGAGEWDRLIHRLRSLGAEDRGLLRQRDVFFRAPAGRLKLRLEDSGAGRSGTLIFYRRPDEARLRTSEYLLAPLSSPEAMEALLAEALGASGEVRKERHLFLRGRTRIHLDRVEGRGEFLELEVVLQQNEAVESGTAEARALLADLGLSGAEVIPTAYVDLPIGELRENSR